jgi:hypothetical protein
LGLAVSSSPRHPPWCLPRWRSPDSSQGLLCAAAHTCKVGGMRKRHQIFRPRRARSTSGPDKHKGCVKGRRTNQPYHNRHPEVPRGGIEAPQTGLVQLASPSNFRPPPEAFSSREQWYVGDRDVETGLLSRRGLLLWPEPSAEARARGWHCISPRISIKRARDESYSTFDRDGNIMLSAPLAPAPV